MDTIVKLLDLEIDEKFFDLNVNGIYYWEFIRALTSCDINSKVNNSSDMFSKSKFSLKKYMISLRRFNKYFIRKKSDILLIAHPRRTKKDGVFVNQYVDSYYDILNKKYSVQLVEEPTYAFFGGINTPHQFPLYNEDIYLTDFHELKMLLVKKLYKIIHFKKYKNLINEYEMLVTKLRKHFNSDNIDFKDVFIDILIRINYDRKYVNKILDKINPKVVMIHYMPSTFKQVMFEVCNERGIKTVEVQHGTITKLDPYINKVLDTSLTKHDSNYIFSFGENQVSKNLLSIKNINNLIPVGLPFFEDIMNNVKKTDKKYVLVISQSTIGEDMAKFAVKLSDLFIKNKIDNKIIFKYHPNELSNTYDILNRDNIITYKNEKSIYDIQMESIIQIGSYSTSLYEGFALGVPTLVLTSMFGSDEVFDIFDGIKKGVYFIKNEKDVLKYIGRDDIYPTLSGINKLWTKNSYENVLKAIDKVMED